MSSNTGFNLGEFSFDLTGYSFPPNPQQLVYQPQTAATNHAGQQVLTQRLTQQEMDLAVIFGAAFPISPTSMPPLPSLDKLLASANGAAMLVDQKSAAVAPADQKRQMRDIPEADKIRNAAKQLSEKSIVIRDLGSKKLDLPSSPKTVGMECYVMEDYDSSKEFQGIVAKHLTNEFAICVNGKIGGRIAKKVLLRTEVDSKANDQITEEILGLVKVMKEHDKCTSFTVSVIGGQHPGVNDRDTGTYATEWAFLNTFKKAFQKTHQCFVDQILFNPTTAGTNQAFSVFLGHNIQVSTQPLPGND